MAQANHPNLSQIIAFEQGELDQDEVVELFQDLIDSGMAWELQGFYGQAADGLIEAGVCMPPGYAEVEYGRRYG